MKLCRTVALLLLALAVGIVPLLGGCGKGGVTDREIVIGFLADFTGVSALTSIELHKGWSDYMKKVIEEDPIEGVKIKLVTYDSKLDYARVVPGYMWLKGQGAKLIWDYNPIFQTMLKDKHQQDKIPGYSFVSDPETEGQPWLYAFSPDYVTEAQATIEWIVKDWEESGKAWPVVVGHAQMAGYVSSAQAQGVFAAYASKHPDKVVLKAAAAPAGSTTWSAEYDKLKGSDIIVSNLAGPSMASFLAEFAIRGYQGRFLGSSLSFMGFWDLARNRVQKIGDLDGCLAMHPQMLWTDDTPFIRELDSALTKYRPNEAVQMKKGTSWPTGWLTGMILTDVVRRAVASVGAENVDSAALNQALAAIDIPRMEGWGDGFKFTEGSNILYKMYRMIVFRSDADDWYALSDWFPAPTVTG